MVTRAVGVDLSPAMVDQARLLARNLPRAELYRADAEHLPFADGEFTAVLCSTSFHHYPDPRRAVAEMARVLASGGRVVLADICADRWEVRVADPLIRLFEPGHVRMHRSEELIGLGRDAGLSGGRAQRFRRGPHVSSRMDRYALARDGSGQASDHRSSLRYRSMRPVQTHAEDEGMSDLRPSGRLRLASGSMPIRSSRARATLERIVPDGHPQTSAASS